MKKLMSKMMAVFFLLAIAFMTFSPFAQAYTERYEDVDISITSKLPPQWLGWVVHTGSTTQTVPWYYKISAVVPGIGETVAGPVTTAYSTYSPLSSTNSIRMMWAEVATATSYKLYKSADNSTFNLLATLTAPTLTYVDEGAAVGAAYSAPTPRGGNLTVENDVTVGDDLIVTDDVTVAGILSVSGGITGALKTVNLAAMNALAPGAAGELIYVSDGASATKVCVSSGTAAGAYTLITSTSTHCQ